MNLIIFIILILVQNFAFASSPMIKNRVLGDANWGTHMPVLLTAAANTKGPILEFGCGDFSTVLLHSICSVNKRYILSLESDKKWLQNFLDLERSWHKFMYIPLFDENNKMNPEIWNLVPNDQHWGLVFIDHHPGERRAIDIQRFANKADVIVIHDTSKRLEHYYKYEPTISSFKYKFVYERYERTTTIVSNSINVELFFLD
jgi:hypothetical protein